MNHKLVEFMPGEVHAVIKWRTYQMLRRSETLFSVLYTQMVLLII